MIEQIVPAGTCVAEARADLVGVALPSAEEAAVAAAVPARRGEFATTRELARRALGGLGHPPAAIPADRRGAPRWPAGVAGSLTHCRGYRAAAVAPLARLAALGIDAEPDEPLPDGVLDVVALPAERAALARWAGSAAADRLLFSAKEAVFKAWYPLTGRMLDFTEARLALDPAGTFTAELLVPGPIVGGRRLPGFTGQWFARDGLVLTAVAVPAPTRTPEENP